jgi:myosin-crossreactive antigen
MKLLTILLLISLTTQAQFHLKVTCNPDHNGRVNPQWFNNYVISYTNDNWQHSFLINQQATYSGFDDNGETYYVSYWQPATFQTQGDAYQVAKKLTSRLAVGKFLSSEYQRHLHLYQKYEAIKKKLCFGCKNQPQSCAKEIVIK